MCLLAAASIDDRGYLIVVQVSGDDPELTAEYDRGFFEKVLATVELNPEDARPPATSPTP
jgi:hypothetical protein